MMMGGLVIVGCTISNATVLDLVELGRKAVQSKKTKYHTNGKREERSEKVTPVDLIFKALYWKAMFFGIIVPSIAFCSFYYLSYRQQQEFLKKLDERLDK